ncbi:MAG: di-heme oxidoredictase family protein [Bacteroidota bacterium]
MRPNTTYQLILSGLLLLLVFIACSKLEPKAPADDQLLDGPVANLTPAQNAIFMAGDVAFNDEVFTAQTGLGSLFVATSCGSCHAGDGKGTPFTTLTRFGQTDSTGNQFLHKGGPQLQNRAIPGYTPESIPAGATFAKFTPPANSGLGFIELVSDADILAMADPNDLNGDGISGVPNWNTIPGFVSIPATAIPKNGKYICRFGKKASTFDLLQQTVSAYNQDMGITSTFLPSDVYSGLSIDPEVTDKTVRNVVAYLQMLKAPIQRTPDNPTVISGKNLFIQIGCENCHKQQLKTGYSPVTALSNQTFFPYTDLLLHDMGSGLDDGYTEGSARTFEWRTPPLWGLGLSKASQGGYYFLMHDGRAKSIASAIAMHGGEGSSSAQKFDQLSATEKQAVLTFLESL